MLGALAINSICLLAADFRCSVAARGLQLASQGQYVLECRPISIVMLKRYKPKSFQVTTWLDESKPKHHNNNNADERRLQRKGASRENLTRREQSAGSRR